VLTFPVGTTSRTFTLTVKGDAGIEPNETFNVVLSAPVGATIGDGAAVATIIDDDTTPQLSVADVAVIEGDSGTKLAVFTFELDRAYGKTASVKYRTANLTASAPSDYVAKGLTTVSFPAGQISRVVTIKINGDNAVEPNETFALNLSAASNIVLIDTQAIGTITNDD
jgi:hypothetical protein